MCDIILSKIRGDYMKVYFPGTVVERNNKTSREFLFGIFSATKGLMLAQVREITGLDTSTIQNWVSRGFVTKPLDKRYSADHLASIIIINMLRDVMKIENIFSLMSYLNGSVETESDNIISESALYNYICDILDIVNYDIILTDSQLENVIRNAIKDYDEPLPGGKQKLINGLKIILVYYASAIVKYEADKIFNNVFKE